MNYFAVVTMQHYSETHHRKCWPSYPHWVAWVCPFFKHLMVKNTVKCSNKLTWEDMRNIGGPINTTQTYSELPQLAHDGFWFQICHHWFVLMLHFWEWLINVFVCFLWTINKQWQLTHLLSWHCSINLKAYIVPVKILYSFAHEVK